ncbi:sugar transferase [Deinococcus cavernae]|uniref:sugar transferase n=1 Tax=Deinococcus cavernae TaxID=2320857 RepID=UPI002367EBAF|nr:sugar transferase [Deinococcus cavernae]
MGFRGRIRGSIPLYTTRHWVRPGITGWAQVNQGYTDSVGQTTEKLQYDFFYVKYCSLSLDALIVWKTILTILTGFGSR